MDTAMGGDICTKGLGGDLDLIVGGRQAKRQATESLQAVAQTSS